MGVLDDAIREHLDLKRRRGADPAEIEKAEREALGPVRRDASATALSEMEPPSGISAQLPGAVSEDFEFIDADDPVDEHETLLADVPEPLGDIDPDPVVAPGLDQPYLDEFAAADPAASDDFDLPGDGPIAAMPPEPEHKPKRRHLFHFRSHNHDDVFEDDPRSLPAELPDDDPFLDEPEAAAQPVVEEAPPLDTGGGEAVGRAQPIQRDALEGETPTSPAPSPPSNAAADFDVPVVPPPSVPPVDRPQPPTLRLGAEADLGRTVEYDVEEAFAEEDLVGEGAGGGGAEAEDILEETPDFLADAPDHDRLWFEQKPPPDFDFDN